MSWTKESVYDNEISPLMDKLIALCVKHEIPVVAVFQYADEPPNGAAFSSTIVGQDHQDELMDRLMEIAKPQRPIRPIEVEVDGRTGMTSEKLPTN